MEHVVSIKDKIDKDPLLKAARDEILEIQPRFPAEPVFSRTGRGLLESEGVFELQQTKLSEADSDRHHRRG